MNITKALEVYAVTDRAWVGKQSFVEQIEESLQNGVTMLQLREKDLHTDAFIKVAKEVKELCQKYKVPFIINDNVEVATKVQADGIHVGQSDMNLLQVKNKTSCEMLIGVSVQTLEQALEAEKNGAHYLGVGAVFPTNTKQDADYVPYDELCKICASVDIPVVAIGGIHKDNIKELEGSHIAGVAVISAIYGSDNIAEATKNIKREVEKIVE